MKYVLILTVSMVVLQSNWSFAAETARPSAQSAMPSGDAEQVNLDSIKEKYWARGDDTEVGVVQNRTYSKKGKIEFSLLGGVRYSDPFLNMKSLGGSIGFHLSEYVSFHVMGFKDFVSPSSALETFQQRSGATTNSNLPRYYLGGELMGSIFYGKLSVLGKSIIYYDFYLTGGGGATNTESGTYVTPSAGIGQRFYINKYFSVRMDYRLMYYNENIVEKVIPNLMGQSKGYRPNWNNVILLGISFMPFGD